MSLSSNTEGVVLLESSHIMHYNSEFDSDSGLSLTVMIAMFARVEVAG